MKKQLLSLALLAMMSTAAFAQKTQGCPKAQACCDTVECVQLTACDPFATLNLTDDQKTKLQALKPQRPTKEDRQAAREQKRNARQMQRKVYLDQVKAILTPEQYVEFLEVSYLTPDKGGRPGLKDGKKKDSKKRGDKKGAKKDGKKSDKK